MIEKPIATSSQEALELVEKAESLDVPVLVGHHRRYNPIIQRANKVITSGEIGKVRAVHANCWFYKSDEYFDEAAWRKKRGAGPISVNLAHDIDLLRYFCGEIDFVQAQTAKSIRGFENEDVAGALLRFRNGADRNNICLRLYRFAVELGDDFKRKSRISFDFGKLLFHRRITRLSLYSRFNVMGSK
jgi:predicted dehydrogenase